jgi:hypothetical protein
MSGCKQDVSGQAPEHDAARSEVPGAVRVFSAINIVLLCANVAFLILQFIVLAAGGVQDGSGVFRLVTTVLIQLALIYQWVRVREGNRKAVVRLTVAVLLLTVLCITLLVLIGGAYGAGAFRAQLWGALIESVVFWIPPLVIAYRNWNRFHVY